MCFLGGTGSTAPYDHPYVSQGWPGLLVFSPSWRSLVLFCSFLADEFLQFPLPNEGLYLLLQVIAIRRVVTVVSVETAIFIPRPLAGITLQFSGECQASFIFDLHQDLINRGIQGGEVCEPPCRGLGSSIISFFSCSGYLPTPILPGFLLPLSLLGFLLTGQQRIFSIPVLGSPVKHIRHGFWVILV